MTTWNLKQACLLEVSGELSAEARRELFRHLAVDMTARQEYQTIRENLDLLGALGIHEPTADQRRWIPTRIKQAVQDKFIKMKKLERARHRILLTRYALAGVAGVAALLVVVTSIISAQQSALRNGEMDQLARMNVLIDRLTVTTEPGVTNDPLTEVEASIRQLQTESPTLANVHDQEMSQLLDALATLPTDVDDSFDDRTPSSL